MHSAAEILCPFGAVRLTTVLAMSLFATLAIAWQARGPIIAGLAWLLGFEAVFQATALAVGHPLPVGSAWAVFWLIAGAGVVTWATWRGHRPLRWPLVISAVIWGAWVATGFHTNFHDPHATGIDPLAETLNETAKMLAAAAYLVPVIQRRSSRTRTGNAPSAASGV